MEETATPANEPVVEANVIEEIIHRTNGEIVVKPYNKGKLLGRGGFAKCYEVTNSETKKIMAAKIIPKSTLSRTRAKQKLITEIKIHKSLSHQYIVKFEHVFEDSSNVYILLELCTNQTLNELIKRRKKLTEPEVQYYLVQIINALKYLHQNKVIHRDLKLGNLFLNDNMEIRLGDFGLATKLETLDERKKTICGTPNYIAPEILDGKGHSFEVDIWSVGVILYTQLIGKPPFETPEVKSTYRKIKACTYSFPENAQISDKAKNLIMRILVLDPAQRPTLDEILNDPFLTSEPIPKTMPRSTLACPPPPLRILSETPSNSGLNSNTNRQINSNPPTTNNNIKAKREGEEKISTDERWNNNNNPVVNPPKGTDSLASSASNFRTSSKDIRQSTKNLGKMTENPTTGNRINNAGPSEQTLATHSEIHVKKWVDYSTKYGLGYLLSDGSCGVYFNDSTKIIIEPNGEVFDYIEKPLGERADKIVTYKLSDYPTERRELQKKVTLLQHFKNYLNGENTAQLENRSDTNSQRCYVKKWMKTRHALMFRLSNKIVQVNFNDKTEIILSSEQRKVTFINLKGERSEHALATALDSRNTEMAKRLRYTKEILTHMLNGTNVPNNQNGDELN